MGDPEADEIGHPGRVQVHVSPQAEREQRGFIVRPATNIPHNPKRKGHDKGATGKGGNSPQISHRENHHFPSQLAFCVVCSHNFSTR